MTKLQKLTQDEEGHLFRKDGSMVKHDDFGLVGRIQTLILQNGVEVSRTIDEMAERKSAWLPRWTNAYVASDFDGSTQHIR
ncbi:hypothetical protein HY484_01995, partial [Candidatus Woesearchaeota archaeon]|nr:hypothetical protein [Candidatus Woesearchaeota archaeon]